MTEKSAIIDGTQRSDTEREEDRFADLRNDALINEYMKIKNEFGDYRRMALQAFPGFIINNSSNLLGAAHVATEMAMFKSSLPRGDKLAEYKGNPFAYAFDATKRVFSVTFSKSIPKNFNWGSLKNDYGNGSTLRGIYRFITDTDKATERAKIEQGIQDVSKLKLSNPWQARTTMFGLAAWGLSTVIPDKKDSPEEVEKMALLQQTNPVGYVGERLRQAIWFPEWHKHKPQMLGLGYLGVGICSTLGSWRGNGKLGYSFNKGYFMTSMFSLAAALPLLFAADDEKAYGGFGTLMMGRLFFLPGSISRKFATGEPGASWYAGATVAFQAENYMQTLIGGAEKKADGTVVDHQEILLNAKRHARQINNARKETGVRASADQEPALRVQEVAEHTPPDKKVATKAL